MTAADDARSAHHPKRILALPFAIVVAAAWTSAAGAQPADDAAFRETYRRQYEALKGVAPDLLVMEIRDRVELIASRGSQVGAASNERRVRGFESTLLLGLQDTVCGGASTSGARPSAAVVDRINQAAAGQRLRTLPADVADLAALSQRLLDGQAKESWCRLKSLDDVR